MKLINVDHALTNYGDCLKAVAVEKDDENQGVESSVGSRRESLLVGS